MARKIAAALPGVIVSCCTAAADFAVAAVVAAGWVEVADSP